MPMNSYIIIYGLLLFTISLACHVLVWRFIRPGNNLSNLLAVFLLLPGILYITLILLVRYGLLLHTGEAPPMTAPELFAVFFLHTALSAAYIVSFPALQANCPSLTILLVIKSSMPRGNTYSEIKSAFTKESSLSLRELDLIEARLIKKSGSAYTITSKGRFLLLPFILFRRLLGLSAGKG